MTLLGFDTSTAATTAAVLLTSGEAVELAPAPRRLFDRPAHASELLPAVHDVMDRAGVGFDDLEAIAVGLGPGTFTGLRIGVATARALAKARGLPLRGVSSLAALAAGMPQETPDCRFGSPQPNEVDNRRLRLALIDAKRGELYAALYDGERELWPPFAATPAALVERLGSAGAEPLAAGDGSLRFREELEAAGVAVAPGESAAHLVGAASLCRVALGVADAAPEQVVPDYLREPDAIAR